MVRRPPPSWKCQNFPFMYYSHSSLFHWLRIKGNDLVRKKCICPPLSQDPITTWFISPMSFHRFKCYEKKMIQCPAHTFPFRPHSTIWAMMILLLEVDIYQEMAFLDLWFLPSEKQYQTNALMSMFKRRNQFSSQALLSSLQSWFIPSIQLKF